MDKEDELLEPEDDSTLVLCGRCKKEIMFRDAVWLLLGDPEYLCHPCHDKTIALDNSV